MKKLLFPFIIGLTILSSCSSGATSDVEEMCDCFLDAGIEDEYDLKDLEHDEDKIKDLAKCALPILEEVRDDLDDMDDDERSKYFGDAIKAWVDCECGQKFLLIGAELYDNEDLDEEFEKMIEQLEFLLEYSSDDYYYEETEEYDYEYSECGEAEKCY